MTKIFMVEMKIQVAVAAEDEEHAYDLVDYRMFRNAVDYQMFRNALDDTAWNGVDVTALKEITHVDQLEAYDWDGKCIPYGDNDSEARIEEILK